jgi:hypothetical protein
MKDLYVEDLANYNGHESCADDREVIREAFDSGIYRLGIEPRKSCIRVPTTFWSTEGNIRNIVMLDIMNSAWSETLYMYRNFMRGNREILTIDLKQLSIKVRVENPNGVQQ